MPSIDNYGLDQYRLSGGGIAVKSVQRGSISISKNTAQIDVIISEVDLNKAVLKFDFSSTASYAIESYTRGEFLDSKTIRFARGSVSSGTNVVVRYEVIEFENVKSVQRGKMTLKQTSGLANIQISSVDMSKSFVFASYSFDEGIALIESTDGNILAMLDTSSSLLINTRTYTGASRTIVYQVVEFE